MPKLKDSRGIFQKTYRDLYRAEKAYKLKIKLADLPDDEEGSEKSEDFTTEDIGITDKAVNAKQAIPKPPDPDGNLSGYFCQNCGEPVTPDMGFCEACGLALDWSGIK